MKNNSRSKRVLLLTIPSKVIYDNTPLKTLRITNIPPLGLAMLAGSCLTAGHKVKICDLNRTEESGLIGLFNSFQPNYVGISFTTPLAEEAGRLARLTRKYVPGAIIIGGGPHATARAEEVLQTTDIDIICRGEGENVILDIVNEKPWSDIKGAIFKTGNNISRSTGGQSFIANLDTLPYPAWHLYDLSHYKTSLSMSRTNPVGRLETSRGCPCQCVYCNKNIFGSKFRIKSVVRVIDEIKHILDTGFREIHIIDDCFTFDLKRAKDICREIIRQRLNFWWVPESGLRVDCVDRELFDLMKKSGCYRVSFGIETGSDEVLKTIKKGQTVADVKKAVKLAKKTGLEVLGFFMMGLPGETLDSLKQTINLAKRLDLDLAKVSLTVPLPGTPYFDRLFQEGKIKETRWSYYNFYNPGHLFSVHDHPSLDRGAITKYYRRFYKEFYFNQRYIIKRFLKSLRNGQLMDGIRYFFITRW